MIENLGRTDLDALKTGVVPGENTMPAGKRDPGGASLDPTTMPEGDDPPAGQQELGTITPPSDTTSSFPPSTDISTKEPRAPERGVEDGEIKDSNSKVTGAEDRGLNRRASEDGPPPPKRAKTGPALQIIEKSEEWVEQDDDFVFKYTKIILRQGDSVFMATTDKREPKFMGLDVETLERIHIPPEHFCPDFKAGLTQAPEPLPEGIYVKEPRLHSWHPDHGGSIAALVLQEADICETLRKHPHPNIAQYHGCLAKDGKVAGLCLTNYKLSLEEALAAKDSITPADKQAYAKAIEAGIRHLHGLGLAHNDINPSNIMVDDGDVPVIIDFDSCRPIGEGLGEKAGTFEWELEGAERSEPENDFYSLRKIQESILQMQLEEE